LKAIGQPTKFIDKGLKDLAEVGFAFYDDDTEYIFVVEMAHWQVGELRGGDKRISTVNKYYASMIKNPFLGMFYDRYEDELSLTTPRRGYDGHTNECPIKVDPNRSDSIHSSVTDTATVTAPVLVPVLVTEVEAERPISSDRVVELWNEVADRYGLPTVRKLTDELKGLIKKASKALPYQNDWDDLFAEIPLSSTLQGRIGDGKWAPSLGWLLKQNRGESEPNYSKAMNGAWRDKNTGGMSELARRNIEAAEQALNRMGIPTKAQTFILKGITDGRTVEDGHSSIPGEVGDGLWTDAEYGEDRDLPGGPGGVYAGAGADGDYLGQEESREISDDRGFEDSDRGE
jgi:hypothetical protein